MLINIRCNREPSLQDKHPEEIRNKMIIPQQTNSQHHIEWQKHKAFPLKSGTRQGCSLFQTFGKVEGYKINIQKSAAFL
jgi:hypothetical protein